MSFSGLETHTATFAYLDEDDTTFVDDGYGGTTEEPTEKTITDVPVRYEPAGQGFVTETTGEYVRRAARIFVTNPLDVGEINATTGQYELTISENDDLDIDGIAGEYNLRLIRARSLDNQVPDVIEIEVDRVE